MVQWESRFAGLKFHGRNQNRRVEDSNLSVDFANMPRRERDDNSRYGRDRRSHSRDDSPHRRRRRSSSRSGDRYDSPRNRVKRESESSPVRVKRGDRYSPTGYRRERSEERSFGHYSKRTQRHRQRESPRRPRSQRSRSPEPWGSHQHDLAYDSAHPPPPPKEKEKPNYGLSGNLAAATNTKNGVVLKYHEPSEAKKTKGWRVYVFKNGKEVDVLELDSQSSYLIGRDRNVLTRVPGFQLIIGCRYPRGSYLMF